MATADAVTFYYNFSAIDPNENGIENFYTFITIFLPCVYSFVFIFGLAGNALVFIILVFYEKLKTLTDIFLLNLAIADWIFLWTLPFWAYSAAQEWIFGTVTCRIIRGLYNLNLYTSMLTLTSITFDRLISITFATKAHMSQTKRLKWGKLICGLIWVISVAFATPQLIFSDVFTIDKTICLEKYPDHHIELVLEVIQVTLGYFIPMLTMIICYSLIIKTLLNEKKQKAVRLIFVIMIFYFIFWTPFHIASFLHTFQSSFFDPDCETQSKLEKAIQVTETISMIHCCINPVIYAFVGEKFRKYLYNFFRKYVAAHLCKKCPSVYREKLERVNSTFTPSTAEHDISTGL
uniref:C-X-C motif chemokine receptor 6 n=1 Tax=Anas platyrhynchos platyrhynchos TaxID=8840 RepID=U3I2B8_ANAPP